MEMLKQYEALYNHKESKLIKCILNLKCGKRRPFAGDWRMQR
ncbi:hypothetical protein Pint_23887 [Pistacia integerrima]|uniref:Uncharacterized protein n=1 Tax=Pistacia integerrima TaxID=434235 RepID=A0ACC0YPE1_9ROSI|nr:hypothetical protein Pint_23887 [Pistacia integerrima]